MSGLYNRTWESEAPDITVNRSGKYKNIREDIEQLSSGKSPEPFLVITAEDSHRAKLIAQHITSYRRYRKIKNISYAKRENKVFVWNNEKSTIKAQ